MSKYLLRLTALVQQIFFHKFTSTKYWDILIFLFQMGNFRPRVVKFYRKTDERLKKKNYSPRIRLTRIYTREMQILMRWCVAELWTMSKAGKRITEIYTEGNRGKKKKNR